jgi:hypothetical protein
MNTEPVIRAMLDLDETDFGLLAQQRAEEHLDLCENWLDAEPGDEPTEPDPSSAPFCGCRTCVVREVLYAAWPIVERSLRKEE